MVGAEGARQALGEGVAVTLAVRRPHEGGADVGRPVGDARSLTPKVGEPEVDIELQQVDPGRAVVHANQGRKSVGRNPCSPIGTHGVTHRYSWVRGPGGPRRAPSIVLGMPR